MTCCFGMGVPVIGGQFGGALTLNLGVGFGVGAVLGMSFMSIAAEGCCGGVGFGVTISGTWIHSCMSVVLAILLGESGC